MLVDSDQLLIHLVTGNTVEGAFMSGGFGGPSRGKEATRLCRG